MGDVESAKVRLGNVWSALLRRARKGPGHSDRCDWEVHTGHVQRSAECGRRGECGMRSYG